MNAFQGEHMNDVLKAISARRSTRQFRPEQITDAELLAIIDAGLQAPSGHNDQSVYLTAIQNPERIGELSDGSKLEMQKTRIDWIIALGKNRRFNVYHRAPTAVIVAAKKDAVSPIPDACAAIENMLLAAESLHIGSCWIGFASFYFSTPERLQSIGIPEGYTVHFGVSLGYRPEGSSETRPARKFEKYFHVIK
jgi:nitroreductase